MSVKDLNTLGNLLSGQHFEDLIADMQKPEIMEAISRWSTVEEDTNFGKLLHKEDLWSLYQYREEKSILYHLCRNSYNQMELQNNPCDPADSRCCVCQTVAPDEIRGLWKLHNFEWIQQNGGELI